MLVAAGGGGWSLRGLVAPSIGGKNHDEGGYDPFTLPLRTADCVTEKVMGDGVGE